MPRTIKSPAKPIVKPQEVAFRLTNPDRVIFSNPDITKRDLAVYYAHVARSLLPHTAGRPLAVVRCPVGTGKQCFFQKHPPAGLPATVKRIEIREKNKTAAYLMVDSVEGLMSLVQHGVIELHTWGSRVDNVELPDRLVFDLDPDPAVAWKQILEAAVQMRRVLSDMGLMAFVKTTGGKGLHVVVPIQRRAEWKEIKLFCRSIAAQLADSYPERYTINALKVERHGRIFIDYLRNDRGSTAVAPYSVRAHPTAPVATPVSWDELCSLRSPQQFTVNNIPARLARISRDPWRDLLQVRQSLPELSHLKR